MASPIVEEWNRYKAQKNSSDPKSIVAEYLAYKNQKLASQPQAPIQSEVQPTQQKIDGGYKPKFMDYVQPSKEFIQSTGVNPEENRRKLGEFGAGAFEGATFGVPRVLADKFLGMDIPRGSTGGQIAGSILGVGKLAKGVSMIPGLGAKTVQAAGPILGGVKKVDPLMRKAVRGAITGGLAINAPNVTELDTPLGVRAARTALAAPVGAAGEVVIPPILQAIGRKIPAFLRPIKKVLSPKKKTFEQSTAGRTQQIQEGAKQAGEMEKQLIGEKLAPSAASQYKNRVQAMEPEALKQVGMADDVIADVQAVKAKYGLNKLPTKVEADDFFSSTLSKTNVNKIKSDEILSSLRDAYNQSPKDQVLKNMMDDIAKSIDLDAQISGKGNFIPKEKFMSLYKQANELFGKSEYMDRVAQSIKESLYKAAKQSGVDDIDKAVDLFRLSRTTQKAQNFVGKTDPDLAKTMQSEIESSLLPKNEPIRQKLREQLGPEADTIFNQLGKGKIAKEEAARQLKALEKRVVYRDYLKRKKYGAENIVKQVGTKGALVGGGLYGAKQLKDTFKTMKDDRRYVQ